MSLWETFHLDHDLKAMHGEMNQNSKTSRIRSSSYPPRKGCMPLPALLGSSMRKKQVQQWGERRVQKKMIQNAGARVDCYSDGTNVVYRQREDWSRLSGYAACIFLDKYDTVLACDYSGTLDVVRLPSYTEDSKPRKLGQILVDNLEVLTNRQFVPPKMKSMQGGNTFVVGSAGSYHVFAAERARKWGDDLRLERAQFSQRSPSTFISASWTLHGPRRKYYRDTQNSDLSLARLATGGGSTQMGDFHRMLQEIQGWELRHPKGRRSTNESLFFKGRGGDQAAKWDFIETNSSFMAAQVDSEGDSFWLRLADDRVHDPVICVDQISRDRSKHCQEHITSCAFASSTCLATAHVTVMDGLSPNKGFMDTFVKLWDIRMLSASRQDNTLSTVRLPQFPYESVLALKPDFVSGRELQDLNKNANDFVISDLSASTHGGGTIICTARSQSQSVSEHFLLNLGHLDFQRIHRQKDDQEHLLYSASESHGVFACVENQNETSVINVQGETPRPPKYKRQSDGTPKDDVEFPHQREYRIRFDLKDRHGLETRLSCLSMNPTGTSLLGGSVDGDLFVWRGL